MLFALALVVVLLAMLAMALGLLLSGRPLRRGCARLRLDGGGCGACDEGRLRRDDRR